MDGINLEDFAQYLNSGKPAKKTDLEFYLDDPVFPLSSHEFDILEWWKVNQQQYPHLSQMAQDILAVPATTVASESVRVDLQIVVLRHGVTWITQLDSCIFFQAFSTGGHVLDDFRSCLKPETVEALICAQDWLLASDVEV